MPASYRFAVVVPVYNSAFYVGECLDSLLSQTYRNFVGFVINDGSTDDSSTIVDQYAAKDERLVVVHKPNGGVSSARNVALDLIEKDGGFDYILFLDSDDLFLPNCLETVSKHVGISKALFFGFKNFDKRGLIANPEKEPHLPKVLSKEDALIFSVASPLPELSHSPAASLFLGNVAFPASVVSGIRFDESMKIGEDQDFRICALMRCDGLIAISDVLFHYRLRKESLSHSNSINIADLQMYMSWLGQSVPLPERAKSAIEHRIASRWWNMLRKATDTGVLSQYWGTFKDALEAMEGQFHSDALTSTSMKKRIFIFKLGETAVRFYMRLHIKRPVYEDTTNFFD